MKYVIIAKHKDSRDLHVIGRAGTKFEVDATMKFLQDGPSAWTFMLAEIQAPDAAVAQAAPIMQPTTTVTTPAPIGVNVSNPPPLPGTGGQPAKTGFETLWAEPDRFRAWLAKRSDIEERLQRWASLADMEADDRKAILRFMMGEV